MRHGQRPERISQFTLVGCDIFVARKKISISAISATSRWTSRQLSRPILREGIFLLVHFSPLFHKRVCSRRLRACKHTRLTPIRFLWYAPSARFIAGEESKFGRVFYTAKFRLLRLCLCKRGYLGSAAQPFFAGALSFTVCFYLLCLVSLLPAAF